MHAKSLQLSNSLLPHGLYSLLGSLVHGDSPGKNRENFFQKIEMLLIPGGTVVKNLPASGGEASSIPGSERLPEEGNGYILQYSCLENPHGQRNLVGYSPWGRKEEDTTE